MANWDTHYLTIVGPPKDIEQCAVQYFMRRGTRPVPPVWSEGKESDQSDVDSSENPSVGFGPGRYYTTDCVIDGCRIMIELEVASFTWPAIFYRSMCETFPSLRIIWHYGGESGCVGYIDEEGDHRWHQAVGEGEEGGDEYWIAEEVSKD